MGFLKKLIKKLDPKAKICEEEIIRVWEEVVGGPAAKHSNPVQIKRSVLVVDVKNSALLYEMASNKKNILKKFKLGSGLLKLKDIRFRIR